MDLCPDEYVLGGYHAGRLTADERASVRQHIARCHKCRELLKETREVEGSLMVQEFSTVVLKWLFQKRWAVVSAVFFVLSFTLGKYFIQFTAAFIIFALKWAVSRQGTQGNVVAIFNNQTRHHEKTHGNESRVPLDRALSKGCMKK